MSETPPASPSVPETAADQATLIIEGQSHVFPVVTGSEGEKGIDISKLRSETGYITYDDGYGNTGSCKSDITFIDGEKGILRYRGYPIEQIAECADFLTVTYLIIYGELPTLEQRREFGFRMRKNAPIPEGLHPIFHAYPERSHPMAILSAMLNSLGCYYSNLASNNREQDLANFDEAVAVLISKVRTLAALTYRQKMGMPPVYPKRDLTYCANFLHMMYTEPYAEYQVNPVMSQALDLFLLMHADHEQNCSTSTVRMVASSGANLFASVSAGVCGLWGPLHGGANQAVVRMLEEIHASGDDGSRFIKDAKEGRSRLMGFGHRVYKNYDPRARILGRKAEELLASLGDKNDPLLAIARRLEMAALEDSYFVKRNLYPNVDFYSGIILKALGIPTEMFTVMFAIGRLPGWIANWREIATESKPKIHRPRQIYTGPAYRDIPLPG